MTPVAQPPVPHAKKGKTAIKYDVVEKTIGQLRADMEAGVVTSEEITRAYLDRIEFYDEGQFGFHAYEIVAADAIAQAKAADKAREQRRERAAARHPDRDQEQLRHVRHGRPPTAASRSRTSVRRGTPSRWRGCARPAP